MVDYQISRDNLHITDSAFVPRRRFERELLQIRGLYPDCSVWRRSLRSLRLEWATHNALYSLGLWRSRTKDVDLNSPQKWYIRCGYAVCGALVWLFIN